MKTIMLVGFAPHGEVSEQLVRAGFFALPAGDGEAALAILNAVCADGFVIDVGNPSVRGERLIDRLENSERWRRMPIIATGARPSQHMRLSRNGAIAEVIPACERGAETVVAAVRRAMNRSKPTRSRDDLPGRTAWEGSLGDVSMRTLRRWIAADAPRGATG
jgi:DNA-binding response OmpR family regulator